MRSDFLTHSTKKQYTFGKTEKHAGSVVCPIQMFDFFFFHSYIRRTQNYTKCVTTVCNSDFSYESRTVLFDINRRYVFLPVFS